MPKLPPQLQLIPDGAIDLSFPQPQYSNIFADTLGNAVTDTDGYQALIDLASQVEGQWPQFVSGLDSALGVLDSAGADLATVWEQDFANSLTSAIVPGDAALAKLSVDANTNGPGPASGGPGSGQPPASGTPHTYTVQVSLEFTGAPSPAVLCLDAKVIS